MADALLHPAKITEELPGAKLFKKFGVDCIKALNGNAVCMKWKGDMVFKLAGAREELEFDLFEMPAAAGCDMIDGLKRLRKKE